jgi:hypothetical protein
MFSARSMKLLKEYNCANIINLGFSGGATGYDGKQYFAADHTWRSDSSTYSNLLSSVELGRDPIEVAMQTISAAKMEASIPGMLVVKEIIFSHTNIFKLPELLKSVKDPESAMNTYNTIVDYGIKPFLSHFMSSANDYVLDTALKTRTMLHSEKTTFDSYMDDKTMNLIERGLEAHGVYFHDQIGSWASEGG